MSRAADDDEQQRFALGLIFILVAAVVASVLGFAAYRSGAASATAGAGSAATAAQAAPAPAEPAALAPAAIVVNEQAVVRVDGDVVKFFFATGKAEVAAGAKEALGAVLQGAQDGKRVQISGYHDATGDAEVNAELAKRRAQAVRDAVLALGVAQEQIELTKPAQTLASGSNEEARRVEVLLMD